MSIKENAKTLLLTYLGLNYKSLIEEAKNTKMSYEGFLTNILENEVCQRKENGVQRRLKQAHFKQKKYLVDFKREHLDLELQKHIERLESLEFMENKENVILIGNPGTGKTHLAIGLGVAACLKGKSVLFISVPNLIIQLKEAMSLNEVNLYKRKFEKYDLVILDELGYISFDKEGNEILFNLLSNRNDVGSIIITTNLIFERWEEIFKDPVLTGALVDRLAHRSHVLDMSGESYRIKETRLWLA